MFGAAQFAKLLAARSEKNAPNGACFHDISFYRLDRTERSRLFPTNLPKVRNRPVRFIDSLCRPKGGIPYLNSKLRTLNSAKKERSFLRNCVLFYVGAADEARTRYLHLGKVALYQMSYGRIKNHRR